MAEVGSLCGLYPYSLILTENGIDIKDKELFAYLKLFSLECYFVKDGKQVDAITEDCDSFCLVGIESFSESSFNNISNISFYKIVVTENEDVFLKILECIHDGKKVIAFADVYYLKYHPLQERYHGQTEIIIHNYNNDKFYISDHHLPTSPISGFEGWINKTELMEALLYRDNKEQKEDPGIITYHVEDNVQNVRMDLQESIKENFDKYITLNYNKTFNIKDKIINSIKMINRINEDEMKKKLLVSVYAHLTGRAGVVISRRVLGELLIDLGYNDNQFIKISEAWQGIAGCFFRISLKYTQKRVDEICTRIIDVVDLEYREVDKWRRNFKY